MADPNVPTPDSDAQSEERSERREPGWLSRFKAALGLASDVSLRASLETALEHPGSMAQVFSPEERLMLINILGFRQLRVEDVMVPRADIIAIDETVTIADLLRVFEKAGHSRIPTYRETLDDPTGMVHIKDVMGWMTAQARRVRPRKGAEGGESAAKPERGITLDLASVDLKKPLAGVKLTRPVIFVPPSMPAVDLLVKMQTTRVHLALVVDEYGGTDGLVSIEDLVEEIVGDIEDEHDSDEEAQIAPQADGSFIADARAPIEDFRELIGFDLGLSEIEEEIDTLGGLVFSLLGRVPVRGEIVAYPGGLEFEILDADPRRVKRLRVRVLPPGEGRKRRGRRSDEASGNE